MLDWSRLKQIAEDIWKFIEPFPKQQILDSSKLKEYADDNFKFDENGRMFQKWVENTVGKGEIAHNKTCTADT